MIRSMTGFGRAEGQGGGFDITVELRSVNNRYLDCNVRLPRAYAYIEEHVKARFGGEVSRGKVEVNITLEPQQVSSPIQLNQAAADQYIELMHGLNNTMMMRNLDGKVDLARFLTLPDVLSVEKNEPAKDELLVSVLSVLDEALANYLDMSRNEGENLKRDILERADTIERTVGEIEARADDIVARYTERLTKRIEEVLERLGAKADEQRIVTEAAIFADKTATAEETVRLKSHIGQLRDILGKGGSCGKKLDFLIQEFVRESNTIGSKSNDLDTTRDVIELKNEIEKMREQIQNIE